MTQKRDFLKRVIEEKVITPNERQELLASYVGDNRQILMHLLHKYPTKRHLLGRFWGDHLGVAYIDLSRIVVQYELTRHLPEAFARKNHIIPLYEVGGVLTVAAAVPEDRSVMAEAENLANEFVFAIFAFPDQIDSMIEIAYQYDQTLSQMIAGTRILEIERTDSPVSVDRMKEQAGDKAIVEFARGLILLGVKQRASDIHIEPGDEFVRIRFRIDGVLQEMFQLDTRILAPLVTRFKILADLNISERRLPQDGRIKLKLPDRDINIRMASVATVNGEKVVLRLLGYTDSIHVPDLSDLCLVPSNLELLRRVAGTPSGIFYVTGPTGSGKSTTLYSLLKYVNRPGTNILTVEDPVEYRLPGINQVQVHPDIGLTFATVLRSFLRLDPDVMLVGEVRDYETARIASDAALTGRLVLTTMHANSAVDAIVRLLEIGVEPFLIAPSVIGVMAQRLVRRLCDACKHKTVLPRPLVEARFEGVDKTEVSVYSPTGCSRCNGTGYFGRMAIHEVFMVSDETRSLIAVRAPLRDIRECANREGYKTLEYDGLKKVLRGMTTLEEIDRVCMPE